MEIRKIREEDAPTLRALYREGVRRLAERHPEDRYGISEQGLDNMQEHWRLCATHADAFCVVAEEDGSIVGWVDAEVSRSPTLPGVAGEVGDLCLEPGFEHAGRPLVEEAVRRLRELGAAVITHTEDIRRPDALFDELGFERDVARYSLYSD